MKRIGIYAVVVCVLLLVLPVAAQEDAGTVARVTFWKVKSGMEKQFEEGLKRHNDWHRQQNDTWTLNTWQIVTGERTRMYLRGTFDHQWSDFDEEEKTAAADEANSATHLDPYIESGTPRMYVYLSDVSLPPGDEGPAALVSLVTFHLRAGKTSEFLNAIGKVHKAIEKTSWPTGGYLWYTLVNGGYEPTFVLALPRQNWAGFTPLEKPFEQMLEEAYGRQEAKSIQEVFERTTKSQWSEIARYRPDLSYVPEGRAEVLAYPPPCETGSKNCPCPPGKRPIKVKRLDPKTGNIVGDIVCE